MVPFENTITAPPSPVGTLPDGQRRWLSSQNTEEDAIKAACHSDNFHLPNASRLAELLEISQATPSDTSIGVEKDNPCQTPQIGTPPNSRCITPSGFVAMEQLRGCSGQIATPPDDPLDFAEIRDSSAPQPHIHGGFQHSLKLEKEDESSDSGHFLHRECIDEPLPWTDKLHVTPCLKRSKPCSPRETRQNMVRNEWGRELTTAVIIERKHWRSTAHGRKVAKVSCNSAGYEACDGFPGVW